MKRHLIGQVAFLQFGRADAGLVQALPLAGTRARLGRLRHANSMPRPVIWDTDSRRTEAGTPPPAPAPPATHSSKLRLV